MFRIKRLFLLLVPLVFIGAGNPRVLLNNEWVSDAPLYLDQSPFTGFNLYLNSYDSTTSWIKEGVWFEQFDKRGSRQNPSAFDYRITESTLEIKVNFSSVGIEEGTRYRLQYSIDEDSKLTLRLNDQQAIYGIHNMEKNH